MLATSREPLGLAAECPSRLAPLPLPGPEPLRDLDAGTLQRVPSVAVFLERAARVRPGFAPGPDGLRLVADIVRRLDGIPLAIELAAGRLSTFSLTDLAQRLDRALDLLGGGPATSGSRHRTLRSTLEWSYQLLTSDEQRLFRHLSVFTDGVDLTAAEEVAAELGLAGDPGSALAHLVEASMIDATFEGRTRYRMLETIRAFGLDRLAAAGEDGAAAQRLLRWAVELTGWIDSAQTHRARTGGRRRPASGAAQSAVRVAPGSPAATPGRRRRVGARPVGGLRVARPHRALGLDRGAGQRPGTSRPPPRRRRAGVRGKRRIHARGLHPGRATSRAPDWSRQPTPRGRWRCLSALALADLSRGAYGEVVEHALAAAALTTRSSENLGIAALAATYAGDLDQARQLNSRMVAAAVSPTLCAFGGVRRR